MKPARPDVGVHPAAPDDLAFMYGLGKRLSDVPRPDWHDLAAMRAFQRRFMQAMLGRPVAGAVLMVAKDKDGARLGFIQATPGQDSVTDEPCGHVSLLAVDAAAEGQGVAAALVAAVEGWALAQGYRLLSLDVFATNQRALRFYERQGFRPESLQMVKPLGRQGAPAKAGQAP